MNAKATFAIISGCVLIAAAAYLLFLIYALMQMKSAREDGMEKINAILDKVKGDNAAPAD